LIIPSNIRGIRANAFRGNNISSLIVPDSVNSIAEGAFASNNLSHVIFLGAPTVIYGSPFSDNTLTSVMYCQNSNGEWDDVIIEGITPQLDESCNSSGEVNESVTYATFDIDQSGSVDALSDGLILLRYFFGLRGDALINNVISPDANRTSAADIEAYIESHMP
jgi:hypothetical protein